MPDPPASHVTDAASARPIRRNPRWLLPCIAVVALIAACVILPEVSANSGPSSAWDPACPRIEATWHEQSRLNPGMLRWFLTSAGPIAIKDSAPGGATTVQLELTNSAGASVASPRVRGMVATAAIERGDSLWVLCQGSSKTSFELVELGLHDLVPRSQAHYDVEGTGRRREEPLDLLRFADGSLGVVYESFSDSQKRVDKLQRFDPEAGSFGVPVVLAQGPFSITPLVAHRDGSLVIGSLNLVGSQPASRLDPSSGKLTGTLSSPALNIDPASRLGKQIQAGNALSFGPVRSAFCFEPPLIIDPVLSHPALRLVQGGQPTPGAVLSIASAFVRGWMTGRRAEEIVSEEVRVPAVLLATPASPFAVELGPEYRSTVRANFLHAQSSGIFLYALDGTTALCAQVVHPPSDGRSIDPPTGFLRFGTVDAASTEVAWKAHVPLPRGDLPGIIDHVTIIPGPDRWMIYLSETNWLGTNIEDPIPYSWTAIPNPVGVPTPLRVQLYEFAQPLPPSGEAP